MSHFMCTSHTYVPIYMFLGILICRVNINYMKILALRVDKLKIMELITTFTLSIYIINICMYSLNTRLDKIGQH